MFQIRQEHLDALNALARRHLHRRIYTMLLNGVFPPGSTPDKAAVLPFIAECDRRAAKLGVFSDAGVIRFVSLSLIARNYIDEIDAVKRVLKAAGPSSVEERLIALLQRYAMRDNV